MLSTENFRLGRIPNKGRPRLELSNLWHSSIGRISAALSVSVVVGMFGLRTNAMRPHKRRKIDAQLHKSFCMFDISMGWLSGKPLHLGSWQ